MLRRNASRARRRNADRNRKNLLASLPLPTPRSGASPTVAASAPMRTRSPDANEIARRELGARSCRRSPPPSALPLALRAREARSAQVIAAPRRVGSLRANGALNLGRTSSTVRAAAGNAAQCPNVLRSSSCRVRGLGLRGQSMENETMDKDRVAGNVKKATGKIKETAGKATGDRRTEVKGEAEKTEGKVQDAFGKVKDSLRK